MGGAPLLNPFFRPEEEHVASGKHQVYPPLGCTYEAVKEPARRIRPIYTYLQVERLETFLTTRMN